MLFNFINIPDDVVILLYIFLIIYNHQCYYLFNYMFYVIYYYLMYSIYFILIFTRTIACIIQCDVYSCLIE